MLNRVIAVCLLVQCSVASANILWDEDVNGDLSGVFGSGPSFNLVSGDNFLLGRTPSGSSVNDLSVLDFDGFSIRMPSGTVLNSISFIPSYVSTSQAVTLNWRVREGDQTGGPFTNTVRVGPTTNLGTIAAEVAGIPLDKTALTFNRSFSFTATSWNFPSHSYTWVFNASVASAAVPEPDSWIMMLVGFGLAGWLARYNRTANIAA